VHRSGDTHTHRRQGLSTISHLTAIEAAGDWVKPNISIRTYTHKHTYTSKHTHIHTHTYTHGVRHPKNFKHVSCLGLWELIIAKREWTTQAMKPILVCYTHRLRLRPPFPVLLSTLTWSWFQVRPANPPDPQKDRKGKKVNTSSFPM
jgi:hypothetical protein